MKKNLISIFALILVFALASCGTNTGGHIEKELDSTPSDYSVGSVVSGVYTNRYFGIGVELDEEIWHYYTDEEMRQLNNLSADLLGDEYKKAIEAADVLYDMMASNGSASISVLVENMGVTGLTLSVDNYLDPQLDQLKTALETAGYSDVTISKADYTFAGAKRRGISVTGTANTAKFEEAVIAVKKGQRFAVATVFTMNGDLDEILAKFYAL